MSVAAQVAAYSEYLRAHPEDATPEVVAQLAALNELLERNPLQGFEPHSLPQREFFEARTKVVAAFAGNQFGKTTSLVTRGLIESVPIDLLPAVLKPYKRFGIDGPAHGWIVAPSNDKLYDSILPTFRKWAPVDALFEGSFDKALEKQHRVLRFANGSTIGFKTYEMDADKFGGATLHWVGYDEPPPREIRDECVTRVMRMKGYEMFAMTPLKVNTGWLRRDIWRNRESPDITVIKGSMRDNPLLSDEMVEYTLSQYASDIWRQAREHGDFVDVGGLIYPEFERCVVEPLAAADVKKLDVVVGIDPGIRNCGIAFGGFDDENRLSFFADLLLQDATVDQYATEIARVLARYGLHVRDVDFVIDPASRSRSQINAETVDSALSRLGIFCSPGQNSVEAGIDQMRSRMLNGRLAVSRDCLRMRDEADEYAAEDRDDGKFMPIKTRDHVLDAGRYVAMHRPYDAFAEAHAPSMQLGAAWTPGEALKGHELRLPSAAPPMGAMS